VVTPIIKGWFLERWCMYLLCNYTYNIHTKRCKNNKEEKEREYKSAFLACFKHFSNKEKAKEATGNDL
jgi:hypothetical protein